ncbi:hypothetical protein H0H92_001590, partial [Tricholoma furcatifolium]
MTKRQWTTPAQRALLSSLLPDFVAAQQNATSGAFYAKAYAEWEDNNPYPEPTAAEIDAAATEDHQKAVAKAKHANLAVPDQDTSAEYRETIKKMLKAKQKRLQEKRIFEWFHNHSRASSSGGVKNEVEAYRASAREEDPDINRRYQNTIDRLPATLKSLKETIVDKAGWVEGGSRGDGKAFTETMSAEKLEETILKPWEKFLQSAYPPDVCKDRLINNKHLQSQSINISDSESDEDDNESIQHESINIDDIDLATTDSQRRPAKLSEYELTRQQNIERNNRYLAELDSRFRDKTGDLGMKDPTQSKEKAVRPRKPKGKEPTRRSTRHSEHPVQSAVTESGSTANETPSETTLQSDVATSAAASHAKTPDTTTSPTTEASDDSNEPLDPTTTMEVDDVEISAPGTTAIKTGPSNEPLDPATTMEIDDVGIPAPENTDQTAVATSAAASHAKTPDTTGSPTTTPDTIRSLTTTPDTTTSPTTEASDDETLPPNGAVEAVDPAAAAAASDSVKSLAKPAVEAPDPSNVGDTTGLAPDAGAATDSAPDATPGSNSILRNVDSLPDWAHSAVAFFDDTGVGEDTTMVWKSLIDQWVNFEGGVKALGSGRRASLPTETRPEEIHFWMKRKRLFTATAVPEVCSPEYAVSFGQWWRDMQPSWRTENMSPDEPLTRHVPSDAHWDNLLSGGTNGIFLVIVALAFWARAPDFASTERAFREAVDDVAWVLMTILPLLPCTGKRPGNDDAEAKPASK